MFRTTRRLALHTLAGAAALALLPSLAAAADAKPRVALVMKSLANEFFQNGDATNALAIYRGLAGLSSEPMWKLPAEYQIGLCYERLRSLDLARQSYQSILDAVAQLNSAKAAPAAPNSPPPAANATPVAAEAVPGPDMNELARMASWRMEHLEWNDRTELQLTKFFASGPLTATKPQKTATKDDTNGSTAAAPGVVQ